jgi:putative Mg2+ transporter-C (MgtC) family protein
MLYPEDLLKILFAILIGGLIGAEREFHNKAAGFRTLIFICLGATLFTILSIRISDRGDPARIAAQIVTGVGFIGAGVIMRDAGRIQGITTAATIWLIAALGVGIGMGQYALAGASTFAISMVLWIFPRLEHTIDNLREERTYEITCPFTLGNAERVTTLLKNSGLRIFAFKQTKTGNDLRFSGRFSGRPQKHEQLVQKLFADPEIKNIHF